MQLKLKTLGAASMIALSSIINVSASSTQFDKGWCTWGAAVEFDKWAPAPGADWGGDSGNWLANAKAKNWVTYTEPRAAEIHAVIVWTNGGRGHVGIVNRLFSDSIEVKEMNWGKQVLGAETGWTNKGGIYTTDRTVAFRDNLNSPGFKFAGFIMPRKTTAYTADSVLDNQAIGDLQALRNTNGNFGAIVPNSLGVSKNWLPDFQLRNCRFNYWLGTLNVYQATWNGDPKARFTKYWEPITKQWIGWTQVR